MAGPLDRRVGVAAWAASILAAVALGGCQTSDYAAGVTSFSNVVGAVSTADDSVAKAALAARTRQLEAMAANPKAQVSFSAVKCGAASGYAAGDCVIKLDGVAMPAGAAVATSSLTKYAAALGSVINDKSATAMSTNVTTLGTAVQGMAKTAGALGLAGELGSASSLTAKLAALAISGRQIKILREATAEADGYVETLTTYIADRDGNMMRIAIDQKVSDLEAMRAKFNHDAARSPADLVTMAQMAAAIDKAQLADPRAALLKLAKLHHDLMLRLQKPRIGWAALQAEAQALTADAQAIDAAAKALSAVDAPAEKAGGEKPGEPKPPEHKPADK